MGRESVGLALNLANLSSIRAFPARLVEALGSSAPLAIDVLICSAQGESPFTSQRTVTADGYERHLGVNHLGPATSNSPYQSCLTIQSSCVLSHLQLLTYSPTTY